MEQLKDQRNLYWGNNRKINSLKYLGTEITQGDGVSDSGVKIKLVLWIWNLAACPLCVFNTTSPNCSMKNHKTPELYIFTSPSLTSSATFFSPDNQHSHLPGCLCKEKGADDGAGAAWTFLPVEQGRWLLQGWPSHSLALPVAAGEGGNWDLHIPSKCTAGDFKGFQSDSWGKTQPISSLAKKQECAGKDGPVPVPELKRESVRLRASTGCSVWLLHLSLIFISGGDFWGVTRAL